MKVLISLAAIALCGTAPAYGFADEILKQVLKNSGKGAVKEGLRNGRTKSNRIKVEEAKRDEELFTPEEEQEQ